jgi:hypothetical protein
MHCKACDKQMSDTSCKWNPKMRGLENLCTECLEEVDIILQEFKKIDRLAVGDYNE